MQNAGEQQPLAWQRASPFFCQEILQSSIVQHGIGQQLLQLGALDFPFSRLVSEISSPSYLAFQL
jgi:hypothetical protein